jgi:hypothetical protein
LIRHSVYSLCTRFDKTQWLQFTRFDKTQWLQITRFDKTQWDPIWPDVGSGALAVVSKNRSRALWEKYRPSCKLKDENFFIKDEYMFKKFTK